MEPIGWGSTTPKMVLFILLLNGFQAVSYTHLDVYKRQQVVVAAAGLAVVALAVLAVEVAAVAVLAEIINSTT